MSWIGSRGARRRQGFLVRGDRRVVFPLQGAGLRGVAAERGGGAGADELGGGQPGPGFLDDQPRGSRPQDLLLVRFPAPVMVVLSSPNVVSDALHLVRYVSLIASSDGLVIQESGDQGAGLGDLFFLPAAAGQDHAVLGGADRQPVFLPGLGVQPGQAGTVGQPAAVLAVEREADALFTRAMTCPPACRIAVIRS